MKVTLIVITSSIIEGCPNWQHYFPCRCEHIRIENQSLASRLNCDHKNLGDEKIGRILKAFLVSSNGKSRLRTVQLERTRLTRIPDELFLFTQLENVYLSGNRIQSIHRFNFSSTLQRVVLNSNSLSFIESGAFHSDNYGDGSIISFEANKMTRFEAKVFQSVLEKMTSYGGAPYALIDLQDSKI